jgi:hypothetical protein
MTVHVTQEHIDKGKKGIPDCCAVALALKSHGGGSVCQDGDGLPCYLFGPKGVNELPGDVQRFIEMFDAGETVEPFSFEITD